MFKLNVSEFKKKCFIKLFLEKEINFVNSVIMSKKIILKKRGFMIEIWILMKIEYSMVIQIIKMKLMKIKILG